MPARGHLPDQRLPTITSALRAGDDVDREREFHLGVELDGHLVATERLDWLGEVNLPPVELDARLIVDRRGDIGGRDRPVQLALRSRLRLDGDRASHQRAGYQFCCGTVL